MYEYTGAYGFKKGADGSEYDDRRHLAAIRMEEIESKAKGFAGEGNNPYQQPGRWFELANTYGSRAIDKKNDRQFLITS